MSDYSLEGRMWKKLKPHLNMSTDKWQSCYETLIIEFWFALDLNIVFSLSPNTSLFSEPHSHFALILIKAARHRFLIQPAMWKLFSKITCRYRLNILTLNMIVHNSTVHLLQRQSQLAQCVNVDPSSGWLSPGDFSECSEQVECVHKGIRCECLECLGSRVCVSPAAAKTIKQVKNKSIALAIISRQHT